MTSLDAPRTAAPTADDPNSDLGFGSVVARESRLRLLNHDGTFNVRRTGAPWWELLSAYHYLLTISWSLFLLYVVGSYVVVNAAFAAAYVACGPTALTGFRLLGPEQRLLTAFFFSVHTLATIGYGNITPNSLSANVLVTIEALVGLLGVAIIAGIMFARFARPTARISFSRNALIAPYRDISALMFRIINMKSSQLVELEAKVLLARRKKGGLSNDREFLPLRLERERVVFFPLAWTIVHPIDKESPLWGITEPDLLACDAEFLILLNGFDETFSQTVHTRSSYSRGEVVWGAKFRSMFNNPTDDGMVSVNMRAIHDYERVPL